MLVTVCAAGIARIHRSAPPPVNRQFDQRKRTSENMGMMTIRLHLTLDFDHFGCIYTVGLLALSVCLSLSLSVCLPLSLSLCKHCMLQFLFARLPISLSLQNLILSSVGQEWRKLERAGPSGVFVFLHLRTKQFRCCIHNVTGPWFGYFPGRTGFKTDIQVRSRPRDFSSHHRKWWAWKGAVDIFLLRNDANADLGLNLMAPVWLVLLLARLGDCFKVKFAPRTSCFDFKVKQTAVVFRETRLHYQFLWATNRI